MLIRRCQLHSENKIKVFVVEDQTIVREGLCRLLDFSPSIRVVGWAEHGNQALELLEESRPDLMLVDIQMPECDGFQLLTQVKHKWPAIKLLILTTFNDPLYIQQAKALGADGFLLKDVGLEQLMEVISRVFEGGSAFPKQQQRFHPQEPLTPREYEVWRCIASGMSNREISDALEIREGTVKNHISRVLDKLDVRDRTQAGLLFPRNGSL